MIFFFLLKRLLFQKGELATATAATQNKISTVNNHHVYQRCSAC